MGKNTGQYDISNPASDGPNQPVDYIPLTNDLLFHMVFSKNKKALHSLLSSILNIPETEIIDSEVLNPLQYTDVIDTKLTVLDLHVHLNGEKYVLVEMQVRNFVSWTNRTLVYACRQLVDQVKGEDFQYNRIQPVIQISIMNYTLFPDHKRFLTTYELKDEEGYTYSDKLQFIVMDLTAMPKEPENQTNENLLEWAEAFRAKSWDGVSQINNSGVKEAKKTMEMIMSDPAERLKLWSREIAEIDYRSFLSDMKEEGIRVGKEEGIRVGKEEGIRVGKEEGIRVGKEEGIRVGKEEGIRVGKEEGIIEGRNEEKRSMALNLFRMGVSSELIAQAAGVSEGQVLQWISKSEAESTAG